MIAGQIENSHTETPEDDREMNEGNEWLKMLQGLPHKKQPAIVVSKPKFPVIKSPRQVKGVGHGK